MLYKCISWQFPQVESAYYLFHQIMVTYHYVILRGLLLICKKLTAFDYLSSYIKMLDLQKQD